MRTRTTYLPETVEALGPLHWKVYRDGTFTGEEATGVSFGKTVVTFEGEEIITDDPGPGRGIKIVDHKKRVVTRPVTNASSWSPAGDPGLFIQRDGRGCLWYDWITNPSAQYRLDLPSTLTYVSSYPNAESKLIADTLHAFYSTNETDNLLNIVEAPQLVGTLRSLLSLLSSRAMVNNIKNSLEIANLNRSKSLLARLKSLQDGIAKAKNAARRRQLQQALKALQKTLGRHGSNISGAYLAYSFGIAPLISDMQKVKAAMKDLKSKMDAAMKSAGGLVSVHRKDQGAVKLSNSEDGTVSSSHVVGPVKWSIDQGTLNRVCTVRGYRSQKFSTPVFQQLDYLMGRFGATGPTALAWELIPWSFVVDWFVDLRNITDRLDNLLTGDSKRVIDICLSEKSLRKVKGALSISSSSYTNVAGNGTTLCEIDISHYTRKPILSYDIVRPSGRFGNKQASLLAALLHQKVANLLR